MKRFSIAAAAVLASLLSLNAAAGLITLSPVETILVSLDGDGDTPGSVVLDGLSGSTIVGRERANAGQQNRRVATFIKFDVAGLASEDILSADFATQFTSRLNTINNLDVLIGVVAPSNTWNDSGSAGSVPLFEWAATSTSQQTLLANVRTTALNSVQTVDLTNVVSNWADGSAPNNGLVVFGDRLAFQGAGFGPATLTVTVPEPTTLSLLGLALAGIGFSRRARRKS